jgi:hypothetical protein
LAGLVTEADPDAPSNALQEEIMRPVRGRAFSFSSGLLGC